MTRTGMVAGFSILCACGGSSQPPAADTTATGAAPAQAAQTTDLCSLLTQDEAEAILKKKPAPPERQSSGDCWYGKGEIILHILPVQFGSRAEFKARVDKDVKEINDKTKEAGVAMNLKVEEVQIGDAAFYDGMSLHVLKGRRVLTIGGAKDLAIAVAGKAVPRW